MNVERRVVGFLILHENLDFCDRCLAARLDLSPERLDAIVAEVARSAAILRDRWACGHCKRWATVTRAIPTPIFALGHRSRRGLPRTA